MEAELIAFFGGTGVVAAKWLTTVIEPTLKDFGQDLQQLVRGERGKNLRTAVAKAIQITADKEPGAIPTRVLVPLLNAASNEDSPEMQDHWAALLANAALDESRVPPRFPQILSALSPSAALLLHWIFLREYPRRAIWSIDTMGLEREHPHVVADFPIMIETLVNLGLIRPTIDYDLQKQLERVQMAYPATAGPPSFAPFG